MTELKNHQRAISKDGCMMLYDVVWSYIWLVFWTMAFIFASVGNFIIPTDFHIFQRGWNHQPDMILHDLICLFWYVLFITVETQCIRDIYSGTPNTNKHTHTEHHLSQFCTFFFIFHALLFFWPCVFPMSPGVEADEPRELRALALRRGDVGSRLAISAILFLGWDVPWFF